MRDAITVQESIIQATTEEGLLCRAISPVILSSSAQNFYIPDDDLLFIDPTNLQAIDTFLEQRHYNSGHLLSPPPITPQNLLVDKELANLLPHIFSLQLNKDSLTTAIKSNNALCTQVHIN